MIEISNKTEDTNVPLLPINVAVVDLEVHKEEEIGTSIKVNMKNTIPPIIETTTQAKKIEADTGEVIS